MIFQVEITEIEAKAIEAHIENTQEWLQSLIDNKAQKCINRLVETVTDKQAKKLSLQDKETIIEDITVESYSDKRQAKDIKDRVSYKKSKALKK